MKKTLALLLAIAATQAIAQRTTYTETYRVGGNQTVPAIRNQGQLTVIPPGTPVMPPITKVSMNATVHIIGSSKRVRPRYIVNSQLNIFAPVGIEMIMVVMPKNEFTLAPEPIVKKWCSQTR